MMNVPWFLGNGYGEMHRFWWGGGAFWSALLVPLAIWSAVWTGLALWHAAKRDHKWWFIAFLVLHTAGILEIVYLLFVARAFEKTAPKKSAVHRRRK